MSHFFPLLIVLSLVLTGCFGGGDDDVIIPELAVEEPVEIVPEEPDFNVNIDNDSAFEEALGEASVEDANNFEEVVDEIDADEVQAAEPGSKLAAALADETNADAVAASEARGVARAAIAARTQASGLEIRPYSEDLFAQVKGVQPALLYFTAEDCEACNEWEAALRADAEAYAEMNALVLLADYNKQAALAEEMRVTGPGFAMMMTGLGEIMGPRATDRLTKEDLSFIFQ